MMLSYKNKYINMDIYKDISNHYIYSKQKNPVQITNRKDSTKAKSKGLLFFLTFYLDYKKYIILLLSTFK